MKQYITYNGVIVKYKLNILFLSEVLEEIRIINIKEMKRNRKNDINTAELRLHNENNKNSAIVTVTLKPIFFEIARIRILYPFSCYSELLPKYFPPSIPVD